MYRLLNLKSKVITPLFPYDPKTVKPLIVNIIKDEFLLITCSAQGVGIGVFISGTGEPCRGTLQWPSIPSSICFHFPYIISLLKNNIVHIHNIETQTLIQVIQLERTPLFMNVATYPLELKMVLETLSSISAGFPSIQRFDSSPGGSLQVLIGYPDQVLGLRMIPWEIQVDQLFDAGKVDQAMTLVEQMVVNQPSTPLGQERAFSYYTKAAFTCFRDGLFEKAGEYFEKSQVDPRTLIALYPDIALSSMELDDSIEGFEYAQSIESVHQVIQDYLIKTGKKQDDELKRLLVKKSLECLLGYLEHYVKSPVMIQGCEKDVDTTLAILYSQLNPEKLIQFLSIPNHCHIPACLRALKQHQCHFALGLLYQQAEQWSDALDLWIK